MIFPLFEYLMFKITMFAGVSLFIYLILDIDFNKIKKEIKIWWLWMSIIEFPEERETRKNIYKEFKKWIDNYGKT